MKLDLLASFCETISRGHSLKLSGEKTHWKESHYGRERGFGHGSEISECFLQASIIFWTRGENPRHVWVSLIFTSFKSRFRISRVEVFKFGLSCMTDKEINFIFHFMHWFLSGRDLLRSTGSGRPILSSQRPVPLTLCLCSVGSKTIPPLVKV